MDSGRLHVEARALWRDATALLAPCVLVHCDFSAKPVLVLCDFSAEYLSGLRAHLVDSTIRLASPRVAALIASFGSFVTPFSSLLAECYGDARFGVVASAAVS